ncbi:MAG: hypothetical protein J6P38_00700 [Acetobacter sp.]|nr:hypothetical protein [Acetobacter sp.]
MQDYLNVTLEEDGDDLKKSHAMRVKKCSLPPIKFLLSISLAFSLSGCALFEPQRYFEKGFIEMTSGIHTPERTHYPVPSKETCSAAYRQQNNLTVADLRNAINYGLLQNVLSQQTGGNLYAPYEVQKMKLIQLSRAINHLTPGAGHFAAAANAMAQIDAMLTPKSLGTYLTGCLRYTQTTLTNAVAKGDNLLLQMSTEMASGIKNVKIPQPTLKTCATGYFYTHPALVNLANASLGERTLNAIIGDTTGETPQEIMSQIIQLSECCDLYSTVMNVGNTFNQAVSEAQNNANYTNIIPIFAQLQPPQLANYYVGCSKIWQTIHHKAVVWTTQKQYYNQRKHYLETHRLVTNTKFR